MTDKYNHDVFISFSFKDQALANNVVHQLDNQYGISCWICTKQIRAGENFREDISKAIDVAKIVVFIQSKNSSISNEVRQEIVEAFDKGKIIMPFILEESISGRVVRTLLKDIHYIDATKTKMLDNKIRVLAKDICRILGKTPEDFNLLSHSNIKPKMIFEGREAILDEIHSKYTEDKRVVFLYGIGGIGKTQIAQQYVKRYEKNYDTIVYAMYNGSIKELILSETPFAIEPKMVRYTLSDGTMEKDDDFYKRKLEKIKKLADERMLIVLDNFDVEGDENLKDLLDVNCRFLITTRWDYSHSLATNRFDFSHFNPTLMKINPIDSMEALKDIFMKNYDGYEVERDDPFLEELIELVNRHTYTVELLAQHMENSGQTTKEMIVALKKEGILSLNEEIYNADTKTKVAYENLLKMFRIFSLDEVEKQILMYLSLMPLEGVNVRDFKNWAGLTSVKHIKSLENRSWIFRNAEVIALHPIIKSVIQHELPATEENCLDFVNRFAESIEEQKSWYLKKADKDQRELISKTLLSIFKTITPETEALYYNSEVLLSFGGDPQYAEKLAWRLHNYYLKNYGKQSYEVGRSAYKLGCLYIYNPSLKSLGMSPMQWLELAESILSSLELHTDEQKGIYSQLQNNLSRMHVQSYLNGHDEKEFNYALDFAMKALDLAKKYFCSPDHPYHNRIAGAYNAVVYVLGKHHEYTKALELADESINFLLAKSDETESDVISSLQRKAEILYYSGRYEGLKEMIQKIIKGRIEHQGLIYFRTLDAYLLLGDCCRSLGEPDEALQAYTKALDIAETIYAPGAKQIMELRETIENIQQR